MSISSPLPSTTFSYKPLPLTLSLSRLPAPTPSSNNSDSTSIDEYEDIFDELEQASGKRGWTDQTREQGPGRRDQHKTSEVEQLPTRRGEEALIDTAARLYPTTDLELERKLLEQVQGGGIARLPDWLRDASGRVNSIAIGEVYEEGRATARQSDTGSGEIRAKTKRTRRVAVGSEDGVVWVFRDTRENERRTAKTRHDREATIVPSTVQVNGSSMATTKPRRISPTTSRPHSPLPPSTSTAFSPPSTSGLSPRLTTRRSSASLSTLSSFTSQSASNPRHPSGPPSLSGASTTTTYSELRSPTDHQRLRKASATVSISTTSVTPAPAHHHQPQKSTHSPSLSYDSASSTRFSSASSQNNVREEETSVSLPPLSPVDQPSTVPPPSNPIATYPLSPIPTRPNPQFRFSPSTDSEPVSRATTALTANYGTSPSPPLAPPSSSSSSSVARNRRIPPSHSLGGLVSRKEKEQQQQQQRNSTETSGNGRGSRSHSRVSKESITNGIGLWEGLGVVDTVVAGNGGDGLGIVNGREREDEEEDEKWDLEELEPVLKVLTPGFGSVVGIETVREDRILCAGNRHGKKVARSVLVVLRQSGNLSLVSLADGRCLGSYEVGKAVKGEFVELNIVERDQAGPLALCSVTGISSSVVCIDLETLAAAQTIEGVDVFDIVSKPAAMSILCCASNSKELYSRTISLAASADPVQIESKVLGTLESWSERKGLRTNGKLVVAWDDTGLSIAHLENGHVTQIAMLPLSGIRDVASLPQAERFVVATDAGLHQYQVTEQDAHREVKLTSKTDVFGVEYIRVIPSTKLSDPPKLLLARFDERGTRSLQCIELDSPIESRALYQTSPLPNEREQVTRSRRIDSVSTLLAFSNGAISLVAVSSLGKDFEPPMINAQLNAAISLLDVIDLGGREVVVVGSINGTVGLWNLSDWEELAVYSLFASPVLSYAHLALPSHPHTLLFVSCNSPIALVSLHPPQLLFTLPGSKTPAQLVATTKQGEVMVLYKQGLARVWDAETGELRRSMEKKTAQGVLLEKEKGWRIWFDIEVEKASTASTSLSHPSITFDLRTTLDDIARDLPWAGMKPRTPKKLLNGFDSLDATPDISRATSPAPFATNGSSSSPGAEQLDIVKRWLSSLVPFGVDADCDETLEQLDIRPPRVELALATQQPGSLAFPLHSTSKTAWTISPYSTAQRLLLITCLLRVFLNYPSTERVASEAIVFFTSCLEDSVGDGFQRPSLEMFANYWLDKNPEVQQAAKTLFGTYLAALSNDETLALVQEWENYLPARQVSGSFPHAKADAAVTLIGVIAVDRFKLLSAPVLADLSASIASYLEESQHPFHQAMATELCSRGFHIWQNYVDAMALVRQLFSIAIGRNPATPSDLRAMARQATVHVAGVNSPLFMSTLLFDILNAPTAVSRNATLKLLGFMIRKKPLVLHHSLPRVAEAVVKSLDPTISDLRETVHQTATVILNELVRTFPSIDFHGKSQRLAVGTQEGSAIVYDLKTATRLYLLEGHRRPITALSWSPDGHRLVTVSLDESKVCVWKTGMGILSIIGAPTQRAGSPPFKEWDFHVGDEALMTTAATLEWIIVDWPAERTVRLRIRETALSFGA